MQTLGLGVELRESCRGKLLGSRLLRRIGLRAVMGVSYVAGEGRGRGDGVGRYLVKTCLELREYVCHFWLGCKEELYSGLEVA